MFQHDGVDPHYDNVAKAYLNHTFPNKWIGRKGLIRWLRRSLNLTSPVFYLWDYNKDVFYRERPGTRGYDREGRYSVQ